TGTSDFSAFVKPRLAIGPKGNHTPEAPDASQFTGMELQRERAPRVYGVRDLLSDVVPASVAAPFAKSSKLAAKGTIEIEIPVEAAANFGVTFMAMPDVSVTLISPSGAVVGKNLAKTPEAGQWFRSIFFDDKTTAGTWKLKVENTSDLEREIIVSAWSNASR
ncbi:MAG TPA: proprotein convertase P-domain-containing protein, partial [Pyrinomonadaceae bacterium]|nr:proprotein convertase P-domain-containing protein [Pyrinomonadaceae bacterium]